MVKQNTNTTHERDINNYEYYLPLMINPINSHNIIFMSCQLADDPPGRLYEFLPTQIHPCIEPSVVPTSKIRDGANCE